MICVAAISPSTPWRYRSRTREFVDPYGGLSDLARQVIRTPATPESSFSDDPLRMMRAARFVAQLGFRPDPEVVAAMKGMTDRISIISAERIRDELSKLLLTDRPRPGIDLLVSTGLAAKVLPELPALRLERDEHHRHKDVYQHSLTVLEQAIDLEDRLPERPDLIIRLAALLHDIGKPATRRFEPGGKVSFHHHDVVGAKLARKRLAALRFSGEEIKAVSDLVALHLRFHGYSGERRSRGGVDRFGGSSLCPRCRRSIGAAARVDQSRLHDSGRGQSGTAAGGVRRPGAAHRGAGRAGGVEVDPAGSERKSDHGDPRHPGGTRRRPGIRVPDGAANGGRSARARNAPAKSYWPGGPISTPELALASSALEGNSLDASRAQARTSRRSPRSTYDPVSLPRRPCVSTPRVALRRQART